MENNQKKIDELNKKICRLNDEIYSLREEIQKLEIEDINYVGKFLSIDNYGYIYVTSQFSDSEEKSPTITLQGFHFNYCNSVYRDSFYFESDAQQSLNFKTDIFLRMIQNLEIEEMTKGEFWKLYQKALKEHMEMSESIFEDCIKRTEPKIEKLNTNKLNAEYVDLGLPSGLKWAKCNLGANNPWEYGDYYMWGSVTPNTNDRCNWKNTPFNNGAVEYNEDYFNAHKSEWLDGEVLKTEYDAAYQSTGGKAHMPTNADFDELLANTTSEWIENYEGSGISGIKFTSKINGNYIFIPASGFRNGSSFNGQGSYGYVWSSSLLASSPYYARVLYLHSSSCFMTGNNRCYGFSVRPVSE